jgi:uncharacterized protein YeaO (DUF488 family)
VNNLYMKRIYDAKTATDGYRILVDRVWPRGITKVGSQIDEWITSITPTTQLRKAFNHDPAKMDWFREAYLSELSANSQAGAFISNVQAHLSVSNVTLLTAARDPQHNHVLVLIDWIKLHIE